MKRPVNVFVLDCQLLFHQASDDRTFPMCLFLIVNAYSIRRAATEPITLAKCLEAFTQEEELGEDEKYYCSACKSHQLAIKKLQIWRLPPILIIHLKRFQCVNNRWIKSHKIVDFPLTGLDPTSYLAAVPAATLNRHKELLAQGRDSRPVRSR